MGHTINIDTGALEGVDGGDYDKFLGIPYAAPPVGPLRWRAPQPAAAWSGVRKADAFGPSCIQPPYPAALAGSRDVGAQSEDCLYLNVWAPKGAAPGAKLPVMMWIHGGSYIIGSGSWPTYDGAAFAEQGIVCVTINYRLNYFGFFAHPALTQEDADDGLLANYGVLDQVAALQWIGRNIAAFGGDPDNVTVFGELAGGTFTNLLMITPQSKGLFQRAIVQSAPAFQRWRRLKTGEAVSKVERLGEAHAAAIGATDQSAAALRAVPADKVMGDVVKVWGANLGPIVDGVILPEREAEAYAAGLQHPLPLIIGANSFEASLMAAYPASAESLIAAAHPDREAVMAAYNPGGERPLDAVAKDIYGDRQFVGAARYIARQAAKVQPTWLYHFSYVPEAVRGQLHGAPHGSEIQFVFRTPASAAMAPYEETDADRSVGEMMNAYWANFARAGDPNGPGLPVWRTCAPDADFTMEFGEGGAVLRQDFLAERLDLVEPLARAPLR